MYQLLISGFLALGVPLPMTSMANSPKCTTKVLLSFLMERPRRQELQASSIIREQFPKHWKIMAPMSMLPVNAMDSTGNKAPKVLIVQYIFDLRINILIKGDVNPYHTNL